MEKLKDFFYDKNDLVVALIIIAVTALLITWRVNVIMDYPEIMAAQLEQEQEENGGADGADPGDDGTSGSAIGDGGQGDGTDANAGQNGNGQTQTPDATTSQTPQTPQTPAANTKPAASGTSVSVTIPSGSSGDKIAQILVDAGVISSKSDFTAAVNAAQAEKKLKAGTFKIPAGSSASEVVSIITK